jgi:hypothetical protein
MGTWLLMLSCLGDPVVFSAPRQCLLSRRPSGGPKREEAAGVTLNETVADHRNVDRDGSFDSEFDFRAGISRALTVRPAPFRPARNRR